MEKNFASWLIPLLLATAVGGGLWYYWHSTDRQQPVTISPVPTTSETQATEPPSGPLHPLPSVEFSGGSAAGLQELPSLNDSDEYFKLELSGLFGDSVASLLADSRIIERVVATVDNLPRDHVAERIRPVAALTGTFVADPEGGSLYSISDESYARYDSLVAVVVATDVAELTDLYRRFYPLFQTAYVDLGYPTGYFNDRLVEAIDDMLATPEVSDPVMLIRPHVLYEYESPQLESLSSGQKLLLRMGSDNAALIKSKLKSVRSAIINE